MRKIKIFSSSHGRSLAKSITWRFLATLTTMSLVYLFTSNFKTSVELGGLELMAKLMLYYLHERYWLRIKWGLKNEEKMV